MLVIKVRNEIANDAMSAWMMDGQAFSLKAVQDIFEAYPDEKEVRLDIHCVGGDVTEGFAIYDYLRTSGRTLYTNIEGMCHSMAVALLLAAPLENRSANPNATALIHKVQGGAYGDVDFLETTAEELRKSQEQIIDLYVDRTNLDRQQVEELFEQESEHTMEELLGWGFLSKINSYNTNLKNRIMVKNRKGLKVRTMNLLKKLNKGRNYEHLDAEGNVMFTTEAEDERIEVGMKAEPDGVFTLVSGEEVVIENGEIVAVNLPAENEDVETLMIEKAELEAKVAELEAENEQLKADLEEAKRLLEEYADATESTFVPENRKNIVRKRAMTSEERKNILRSLR